MLTSMLLATSSFIALQRPLTPLSSAPRIFATLTDSQIDAARTKLNWEKEAERQAKPVLNLSARERTVVPAEETAISDSIEEDDEEWIDGKLWEETRSGLIDLKALADDADAASKLLAAAPQLARLEPSEVLECAKFVIEECGGTAALTSEPSLLTYRADDVRYGLKFLATMMMVDKSLVASLCAGDPKILINAIDGGMQERAVAAAIGAANTAGSNFLGAAVRDAASAAKLKREARKKGL